MAIFFVIIFILYSLTRNYNSIIQLALNYTQWLVTANADVTATAVVLLKVLATVVSKGFTFGNNNNNLARFIASVNDTMKV